MIVLGRFYQRGQGLLLQLSRRVDRVEEPDNVLAEL